MISINICGDDSVYLPDPSCNECDALITRIEALEERVSSLEALLGDLELINIAKLDEDGVVVSVDCLGKVVE